MRLFKKKEVEPQIILEEVKGYIGIKDHKEGDILDRPEKGFRFYSTLGQALGTYGIFSNLKFYEVYAKVTPSTAYLVNCLQESHKKYSEDKYEIIQHYSAEKADYIQLLKEIPVEEIFKYFAKNYCFVTTVDVYKSFTSYDLYKEYKITSIYYGLTNAGFSNYAATLYSRRIADFSEREAWIIYEEIVTWKELNISLDTKFIALMNKIKEAEEKKW